MLDHPIIIAMLSVVVGFCLKFVWDRWLSQTSRITRNEFTTALGVLATECKLRRETCLNTRAFNKAYFEGLITAQGGCIDSAIEAEQEIIKRRVETRKAIVLIMMTQIKICEALRLDCGELSRMLVDMGATE